MKRRMIGGIFILATCICFFISNMHRSAASNYESSARYEKRSKEMFLKFARSARSQSRNFLFGGLACLAAGGFILRPRKSVSVEQDAEPTAAV